VKVLSNVEVHLLFSASMFSAEEAPAVRFKAGKALLEKYAENGKADFTRVKVSR